MEEVAVDKSKVTVRVPKRLWKGKSPEYVEWQEFKLKTKLMPNGYRVTLAAVYTEGLLFFGASACSPSDYFEKSSAYPRAIGRARQIAFLHKADTENSHRSLLSVGVPYRVESFTIGIITDRVALQNAIRDQADKYQIHDTVAHNAERRAVIDEIYAVQVAHGHRFTIRVTSTDSFKD